MRRIHYRRRTGTTLDARDVVEKKGPRECGGLSKLHLIVQFESRSQTGLLKALPDSLELPANAKERWGVPFMDFNYVGSGGGH